jgi:SAM-dependent methyltransferase
MYDALEKCVAPLVGTKLLLDDHLVLGQILRRRQAMSLNQVNEGLNDAFETYFPPMNPLSRLLYGVSTVLLGAGLHWRRRLFGGKLQVNERIVEYPQILRWLPPVGSVLDIGCVSSRLPIQLASLGYIVHSVDVRPYPFRHPNFCFFQADLLHWTPPQSYDVILLVSVIEHFGIGGYGDLQLADADFQAMQQIRTWLQPGGRLLVSVPYGAPAVTDKHRIYDAERLGQLFAGFEWLEQAYFQRHAGSWLPSTAEALRSVASPGLPPNGVAILNLR